jgi:shikimate dehydrogenase
MKRAYVIGAPIRHSISPAMHNAAFTALGIEARYESLEVAPAELEAWVRSVRVAELLGFNVTVPHKEAIVPLLDEIAGDAVLAGAVNTVVQRHGKLVGLNTDTVGFRRLLADEAGTSLHGKRVVLLGAGGAARAIAVVALQDETANLVVANRHVERAQRLLEAVSSLSVRTAVSATGLEGVALERAIDEADIIVNATSVGLASDDVPIDPTLIRAASLVVDLIYNPPETALLGAAAARGARAVGGLGMLVHQAAAAFEAWTYVAAPVEVMRQAAAEALAAAEAGSATPLPNPPRKGGRGQDSPPQGGRGQDRLPSVGRE